METVISLFQKGGVCMYPLLLCSITGVAISIEKLYHLYRAKINPKKLMDKIKEAVRRKDYANAIGYCEATPGPVARALATAIELRALPDEEVKQGIEESVLSEVPRLERFIPALATVVTLSPLLGLLGTITGLMKLFNVISQGDIGNSAALSAGIAEALITTATGLSLAIPFLAVHNYLSNKVESIVNDMEKSVIEFLNFFRTEVRDAVEKPAGE